MKKHLFMPFCCLMTIAVFCFLCAGTKDSRDSDESIEVTTPDPQQLTLKKETKAQTLDFCGEGKGDVQRVQCQSYQPNEIEIKETYKNDKFQDTRFVSFSLEEIKNYIAYIESIQEQNKAYDIDGLRIYFGAYGKNKRSTRGNRRCFWRQL